MDSICFSGGAPGADFMFGECALLCNHKVMHFSFLGHRTKTKKNVFIIPHDELLEADNHLLQANKVLKRGSFPYESEYVNNMLRRNFFQIKGSEKVYAVTYLDKKTGLPKGGTAWAVVMAAQRGIKEIYLFDQSDSTWWEFNSFSDVGMDWIYNTEVPPPVGHYTGIGSRDLIPAGENAIIELFEECE